MPPSDTPVGLRLITYQVGFGDCFLLTFRYAAGCDRHVLFDFGSTGLPKRTTPDQMLRIAQDIGARCQGGRLAIVATHRHADHINGFATQTDPKKPKLSGDFIRTLEPEVVVQPWTENPDLPPDATGPANDSPRPGARAFRAALENMQGIAQSAINEGGALAAALKSNQFRESVANELSFLGEDNLSNPSAVQNLIDMGRAGKPVYTQYGGASGLEPFLPGVGVHVLGPPTVNQSAKVRNERDKDPDEFWQLRGAFQKFWSLQANMLKRAAVSQVVRKPLSQRGRAGPFSKATTYQGLLPPDVQFFRRRLLASRGEQLLELVRALDEVLNNTSLILVFEVNGLRLLFPGDAQIENWSYALEGPDAERNKKLLSEVGLYKVGHHGSRNATPRTLWGWLDRKDNGLQTVVSTMSGKHGSEEKHTEVPRKTLVTELKAHSDFFTTQSLVDEIGRQLEIDLSDSMPKFSGWLRLTAVANGASAPERRTGTAGRTSRKRKTPQKRSSAATLKKRSSTGASG